MALTNRGPTGPPDSIRGGNPHGGVPDQTAIVHGGIKQLPMYAVPVSQHHTVTPGQSLGHIANIHGVSQDEIASHPANRHLMGSGPLIPGTRVFIPFRETSYL